MVKRRVRAKNQEQALKRARREWKSLVVSDVNLIQGARLFKGEKLYQVIAHKRKVAKK